MNLTRETLLLSLMMMGLCSLPLWVSAIKKISHFLFLAGTGALVGICFFDLLPDVYEMGGISSLALVFGVWVVYSLAHYVHYRKKHVKTGHQECHGHHHEDEHHHVLLHSDEGGVGIFIGSMMIHCFASGILLAVSFRYGELFSRTVFLALLTHKAYESLIVSTIVLEKVKSKAHALVANAAYALALPLGVVVEQVFNEQISMKVSLIATCVALGTLFGCMIFDFLLPSIEHVKKKRNHLI